MVHVLEESWRVLAPNGVLVDLRPYLGNMRLEVLSDDGEMIAGLVDDTDLEPDHAAVRRTLEGGVKQKMFIKEEERFFDYAYYWDTLDEFKQYVDENWSSRRVPKKIYRTARKLMTKAKGSTRIRIRDERVIARYRKVGVKARR